MFNRKFSLLSSCLTIITVICSFKLLIFADTLTTDSWNSDDAQIRAKPINQAQYFNQLLLKQQKSNGFQPNTPSSLSNHDDTGVTADVTGNGIDHNELIDDISSSSLPSLVKDNGIDDIGDIRIAVKSKRRYEYVPVHYDRDDQQQTPRMIEIVSDTMPLRLHFKSQSAAIVVTQSHMSPSMKPIEETVSMDEPYRLSHKAYKPIVQDVNEIIQPYRNIVQQVKPVIENIRTIVPKDNDIHHQHQSPSSSLPNTQWNGHFQKNNNNNNNINDKINTKTYTNRFYEQQRQTSNGYRDQVKTSESQHHGIQKRTALNKNTEPDRSIHHNTRQNNFHNFIRNPRIIPNNSNDNRRKKNNHLMQLESSSLQSTYVPRIMNGKHNENDQIVGDLYKDKLIKKKMDNGIEYFDSYIRHTGKHIDFLEHDDDHHHSHDNHHHLIDHIINDNIDDTDTMMDLSSNDDHGHDHHFFNVHHSHTHHPHHNHHYTDDDNHQHIIDDGDVIALIDNDGHRIDDHDDHHHHHHHLYDNNHFFSSF